MPLPDTAPPASAPAPRIVSRICSVERLRSSSCMRTRWPPAIWPLSCAMTPISWFGVSVRMIRPVLMKMRWPPATKALSELSWTIMISMPLGSRPAARQTGTVRARILFSISASRMRLSRGLCCARAAPSGASAKSAREKRMMMRLNTGGTVSGQAMNAKRPRQSRTSPVRHALALAGLFLLAACGRSETDRETEQAAQAANPAGMSLGGRGLSRVVADGVSSPFSAVAADESRAAEVGRDILLAGGNAADAAVAMYFAMAVTLPSAASLGASGACIVHNDKTKAAEAFVFPPIAAPGTVGGQPFIVPSGVRAITLMHVRHGSLRWEATVAPAERLARFGVPVSRALARDLQTSGAMLGGRAFGGGALAEGSTLTQPELAGTLGSI